MKFKPTFAPSSVRSWKSLPRPVQLSFNEVFDLIENDPRRATADLDVHQIYGYQNVWTVRIPPYRGIYAIEGTEVVMVIFGHRDSIYSRLHRLIPPRRQHVSRTASSRPE